MVLSETCPNITRGALIFKCMYWRDGFYGKYWVYGYWGYLWILVDIGIFVDTSGYWGILGDIEIG
jgi:hypothetical protein